MRPGSLVLMKKTNLKNRAGRSMKTSSPLSFEDYPNINLYIADEVIFLNIALVKSCVMWH
jgi:hypothetical protein